MSQSTLNKTQVNKGLFALFKGDSGSGKSVAALSFPSPYVFDFDFKMPSISMKHFPDKEVHWDTFSNIFEIDKQIAILLGSCPYETLIIDSITGLVNICMKSVGEVKGETVPNLLSKTKGGAIEMMGIDYYSAEDRFCSYFIDKVKELWDKNGNPKNVIITAHVTTVESTEGIGKNKIITQTRSIVSKGKKFAAYLPTGFDNIYVFGHEMPALDDLDQSVKRVCITESFGMDSAKCSYRFPQRLNFTNGSLYDLLKQYDPLGEESMGEANQS